MNISKILSLAIALFSFCSSLLAQEEVEEVLPKNTFTIGVGRAHEITSESDLSNMGLDYLRRITNTWEVGIQVDLDWEKRYTHFEGVQLAGIVAYSITPKWPVFTGFGIASEKDHQSGFYRIGTEYVFYIDRKQLFFIAPGTFFDYNKDGWTTSLMIVLGVNW